MTDTGCYLYAVGRNLSDADVVELTGLESAPLRVVEHRGLSAVISTVDLDEFGDEALRRNLENLVWLEDVARTHDDVVRAVSGLTASAPLRLATICLNEERVKSLLDDWYDALVRALDRVEGRKEWSVKVLAAVDDDTQSPATTSTDDLGVGAGAAYLKRRKEESERKLSAAADAGVLADEIHAVLSSYSVASRRLPPQDPRLSGHEGAMTLNAAYLVDSNAYDDFTKAARDLDEKNSAVRLEVQGPWPPYSFATLEES